jgi:predicted DsbA family dithiol-disulfide isomerase
VSVNSQTLTTADLEPALRRELDSVEDKIAEARRQMLDLQINSVLLEIEGKKRRIDTRRLYQLEVSNRIPAITQAQIKKFVDENRSEFQGADPAVANMEAASYLREENERNLADELVKRLRKTIPVVPGVDINSPNLNANSVVATIGGLPLKAEPLIERLKPIIYAMRLEAFEFTRRYADEWVNNVLLLEEARRRQIGPEEIIRAEISEKIPNPTEEEVAKFYADNKARIGGDLTSVRTQLASYLQEQSRERLEKDLSERLRNGVDIRWLISPPPPPIQNISVDDDPVRGEVTAPVTIVEFTDYQCSACAAMHPVLDEILRSYGAKVRLVIRDYPLGQHEHARKAAEAANAAHAQGKFFEYVALLFKNQKALDVPSLKKYASELGLNRVRFDAALDRGVYAAEVQKDIADGVMYGVSGTPTIFINGVRLTTMSEEALRDAIDRALPRGAKSQSPR